MARAEQIKLETQKSSMGTEADIAGKYADVATKYSEIENSGRDRDIAEFTAGSKAGNDARSNEVKSQQQSKSKE